MDILSRMPGGGEPLKSIDQQAQQGLVRLSSSSLLLPSSLLLSSIALEEGISCSSSRDGFPGGSGILPWCPRRIFFAVRHAAREDAVATPLIVTLACWMALCLVRLARGPEMGNKRVSSLSR